MNKTCVVGDIHGGLKALQQVLERANVTTNDQIIFLGDYVDGWSESPQVLDYLIQLNLTHNCIFLRGNHDDLLLDWLQDNKDNRQWYQHGGESTVLAYRSYNSSQKSKHIHFLKSLKNYHLDQQNRLFVHAGFTNLNGIEYEYFDKMFYWERTLWEMAVCLNKSIATSSIFYPRRLKLYNEIFIGHTPVTKLGFETPTQMANVWNIDTGAAFLGKLSVMDIETKQFWQSDALAILYLGEIGRNRK